ncbi:copper resistance protein B [Ghiorsea bivora]|uniref:copper resistance protein B n=1 Tax=Ghiorsea bivora TaxID=1485545 RepID=UPI00057063BD|nr:copper resistance protein B [Ghiorsea bivora]
MSIFRVFLILVSAWLALSSAQAKEMQMDAENVMKKGSMQGGDAPADARSSDYSDGYEYRHMAGWEDTDEIVFGKLIADQMEYRSNNSGNNSLRWDMQAWRGTDYNKLWMKFEGDQELLTKVGALELQTLYSHAVSAFWDLQAGIRFDQFYGAGVNNQRTFAVVGFQGLAPYWFDLEPALFISDKGDVSARITGTYDLLFTQRLILQPRLEINLSFSDVPEFDVGKGINDLQLGMRLRYEVTREFAPYIGVAQQKKFGTTATFVKTAGEAANNVSLIAGLRWWF